MHILYSIHEDCQGIVGHREDDFDFRPHLSQIFPYVTIILICLWIRDPEASSSVGAQSLHQAEKDLVVWIDLHPHDALCAHIVADFLEHRTYQQVRSLRVAHSQVS